MSTREMVEYVIMLRKLLTTMMEKMDKATDGEIAFCAVEDKVQVYTGIEDIAEMLNVELDYDMDEDRDKIDRAFFTANGVRFVEAKD